MSEAPKKIWVESKEEWRPSMMSKKQMYAGQAYIRADLVDGLVEALEALTSLCEVHGDFRNGVTDPMGTIDEGDYIANLIICDARAALKAMEEG
jgi:hypothetical protein